MNKESNPRLAKLREHLEKIEDAPAFTSDPAMLREINLAICDALCTIEGVLLEIVGKLERSKL